jgi:hypothetical protein
MAQRRKPKGTSQPAATQDTEATLRQLLQELMAANTPDTSAWTMGTGEGNLPFAPSPPYWEEARGRTLPPGPGTDVAQMTRLLETIAPGIRSRTSGPITMGPNTAWIKEVLRQRQPELLGTENQPLLSSNARGMHVLEAVGPFETYSPGPLGRVLESIYLEPTPPKLARGARLFETLAHELTHGIEPQLTPHDESAADIVGKLARMYWEGVP